MISLGHDQEASKEDFDIISNNAKQNVPDTTIYLLLMLTYCIVFMQSECS